MLRPALKCGAWSPSLDGPWTLRQEWSGLVSFVPGVQIERVFWDTQLGYIGSRITISVRRYDLAMV